MGLWVKAARSLGKSRKKRLGMLSAIWAWPELCNASLSAQVAAVATIKTADGRSQRSTQRPQTRGVRPPPRTTSQRATAQLISGGPATLVAGSNHHGGGDQHRGRAHPAGGRELRWRLPQQHQRRQHHHETCADRGPHETHHVPNVRHQDSRGQGHHQNEAYQDEALNLRARLDAFMWGQPQLLVPVQERLLMSRAVALSLHGSDERLQRLGRGVEVRRDAHDQGEGEQRLAQYREERGGVILQDVLRRALRKGQVTTQADRAVEHRQEEDNPKADLPDPLNRGPLELRCHWHDIEMAIECEKEDAEGLEDAPTADTAPLHLAKLRPADTRRAHAWTK
mmetsp:Transcript_44746/g.143294  ORF Transcript_44746/g.143294 Transcript_44746/m.143294 type:complete len:338 (-) Transcript_44746:583-1596(-)